MFLVLLIVIPLIAGIVAIASQSAAIAKIVGLVASLATLGVLLNVLCIPNGSEALAYSKLWIGSLGANFSLLLDGPGKIATLLTAVSFPIIFIASWNNGYKYGHQFWGLMLLAMAGLMGVFLANDMLLFYFFWELALIPTYFLCSIWGGEKRIQVSFKFFIYTFVGSVLMLIGIISLYGKTPDASFSWKSFTQVALTAKEQLFYFWLFFVAFAIKMPIFPLHTWQPDAYEQSPTTVTMVLSGIMVKMGLFAVIRWLFPIFPEASSQMAGIVITLSIIGVIYASLIAIRQDDIKRLIAYSSIAHIGIMAAALFTKNNMGYEGAVIQMFSHGINIIGLWIVVDYIEHQTGVRKMSELGGLAQKAPNLTILFIVLAFANVSLPLTNAFIGEFLMFNGIFQYSVCAAVVACLSIILGAVYTLGLAQKTFYGEPKSLAAIKSDAPLNVIVALSLIVVMIIAFGVYPKPLFNLIGLVTGAN
ncbi:complex I subunit 4 family protein [Polluticaenibacter yanchengensis]|uniref:NADH-quinone oxidoreductase subunit M n=1 Tax=Polluticaenibacter yanchengensis TaxID=3014562 RepID=A0ABT4UET5_9BACT|nr:NADH-quinone oxidoreductase subunit M [Chitinophagaceae bacterium LY-5]